MLTLKQKNAALFNPSLLSKQSPQRSKSKFTSIFFGARLIDRDNFLGNLEQYQSNDNETKLSNALANFNSRVESQNLRVIDDRNVLNASSDWLTDIQTLSDKPLRVSASGGFSAGYQSNNLAFSFHFRKTLVLGSLLEVSNVDIQSLQSVLQFLDYFVDLAENQEVPDEFNVPLPYLVEESTSRVDVRGASYDEKGFTIARHSVLLKPTILGSRLNK